jgi:anti-anti-sigma factor
VGSDEIILPRHVDASTAPRVRARLRAALAEPAGNRAGDPVVLDLADVQSLDDVGLGVLLGAHLTARDQGRSLVLRNIPDRVVGVLYATRLHRVLVA